MPTNEEVEREKSFANEIYRAGNMQGALDSYSEALALCDEMQSPPMESMQACYNNRCVKSVAACPARSHESYH
jgi:hypothetical protein